MANYTSGYGVDQLQKIIVIDRCPLVVDGLRWRFQNLEGVEVVRFSDPETAKQQCLKMTNIALFISEYAPNHQLGLDYVQDFAQQFTAPLLIMVDHLSSLVMQALRMSGAVGVVNKSDPDADIEGLVSKVLHDQPLVWEHMAPGVSAQGVGQPMPSLTKRQLQVLALITQGCSNREIGECLNVAEGTVKAHVSAVMKSLGARNRVDLTLQAQRFTQGIV